jgi:hypothetical protein
MLGRSLNGEDAAPPLREQEQMVQEVLGAPERLMLYAAGSAELLAASADLVDYPAPELLDHLTKPSLPCKDLAAMLPGRHTDARQVHIPGESRSEPVSFPRPPLTQNDLSDDVRLCVAHIRSAVHNEGFRILNAIFYSAWLDLHGQGWRPDNKEDFETLQTYLALEGRTSDKPTSTTQDGLKACEHWDVSMLCKVLTQTKLADHARKLSTYETLHWANMDDIRAFQTLKAAGFPPGLIDTFDKKNSGKTTAAVHMLRQLRNLFAHCDVLERELFPDEVYVALGHLVWDSLLRLASATHARLQQEIKWALQTLKGRVEGKLAALKNENFHSVMTTAPMNRLVTN